MTITLHLRDILYLLVIIALTGYLVYSHFNPSREQQIAKVPVATVATVGTGGVAKLDGTAWQRAFQAVGVNLTQKQADKDVQAVKDRLKNNPEPDFSAPVKKGENPDDVMRRELNQHKEQPVPDRIGKEDKGDGQMNYYGISEERRYALGVYFDLDRDGSKGVYYRDDRTTVSAGEKYHGGFTSRVMYDVFKFNTPTKKEQVPIAKKEKATTK